MKVLMVNTAEALRYQGGDLMQMRQTAAALQRLGVTVAESFDNEPDASGFDLAHVFNLRTIGVTPLQVRTLKRHGLPVVMSPIYSNPSIPYWGSQAVAGIFGHPASDDKRSRMLNELAARTLTVARPNGPPLAADRQNRAHEATDRLQRDTLRHVDHLLPNSYLEIADIRRTLGVSTPPFTVVPCAVNANRFADADAEHFSREHGVRNFVLQVGRLEPSKNQLLLALAMREIDAPLVLVGGQLHGHYLEWLKQYGPAGMVMLPNLPQDQLAHAYAAARVHASPSWSETCGLAALEAAFVGCSVVMGIYGHEVEYFREEAYYCDPADVASIRAAVKLALANHATDAGRRESLQRRIRAENNWDRAAEMTLNAYRLVAGGRSDASS
jgi:glycosyltransferase involved in cell wall biosynthesis